jgi:hypothetical protein
VVDVACQVGGRAHVFSALPIEGSEASS